MTSFGRFAAKAASLPATLVTLPATLIGAARKRSIGWGIVAEYPPVAERKPVAPPCGSRCRPAVPATGRYIPTGWYGYGLSAAVDHSLLLWRRSCPRSGTSSANWPRSSARPTRWPAPTRPRTTGTTRRWPPRPCRPAYVVRPSSAEEVAGIIRIAGAHGIPVTARGSGSGMCGACRPQRRRHRGLLRTDERGAGDRLRQPGRGGPARRHTVRIGRSSRTRPA